METNTPESTPPILPKPDPSPEFVQKPLENRMIDGQLRNRLAPDSFWLKVQNFYQENKPYFWVIGLGAVIIGILAFFALHKSTPKAAQEAKVTISIDAPTTLPSGGDEVMKIKVENQDKEKLTGMQLELVYPDGMVYESSVPKSENLSGTVFAVPDLVSGLNAVVTVKAKVSGNVNDSKTVSVKLHYKYSNFNSEFIKTQQLTILLTASNVAVDISGPTNTNNGQLIIYTLKYQNNSDADVKNARIRVGFPDGFKFASSQPQPDLSTNIWNVPLLPKGSSGSIAVQGSFNGANPGESKTLTAEFLILGQNGDYFTQSSTPFVTAIGNTPLLVSQVLDQNTASDIVNPGDTISVNIKYQNNAAVPAKNVNVVVSLDSKALDLSTIQAEGAQVGNSSITWNPASAPNLETVAPSESGNLHFTVKVRNPATKDSSKNLNIVSHVKIKSDEYEAFFPGGDLSLKISSPSSIFSQLDYVSGQLPPQVGKSTVYKVTITMKNATNDFSNTLVAAFIPLGPGSFDAASVNSSESGKVTYDSSAGKLTWSVGGLAAHTGQFTAPRTLSFNLRFIPSSSQANTSPTLMKKIKMDATDSFTSQQVHNETNDITTGSLTGDNNYNNGQVIQ